MAAADGPYPYRWSAHPWRARALRLAVYGLPLALSIAYVHLATSLTTRPGELWLFVLWWAVISITATAVVWVTYVATRRLLPLGALLELSLVFPDAAPSRFQLALRTGTVESLVERLRGMRDGEETVTTQEAAEILLQLAAALSVHDRITRGHAERVRAYSYLIGRQVGLSGEELDRLNWSALLHDVGKLQVSAEILNKQGKPSDSEWEVLRLHPLYGETLVEPLRGWLGEWLDAVGEHHERWDGTGYPRGLAAEQISRGGRIVAIADVFDVITSARSYKKASTTAEGRAEIVRCAGTQFDPRYVRAFVEVSLGRMRLVMGPLSWLAHAPLLARVPAAQWVGAPLGGVAAVTAATATLAVAPVDSPRAAVVEADRPARPAIGISADDREPTTAPTPTRRKPQPRPKKTPPSGSAPVPGPDPTAPPAPSDESPPEPSPSPSDEPKPKPEPAPAPPAPSPAPRPPRPDPEPDPEPAPPPSPTPPPTTPPPPAPPPPSPNRPPTFRAAGDQSALEDGGSQAVSGWASEIAPGPSDESSQSVTFDVSNVNPALFAVPPAVSPDGTLTYTPAPDANGAALVSVVARDDGGTANGGDDTSDAVTFTITVVAVNDAPRFTAGPDQTAISLLGAQTVAGWATGISPGPSNESSQTVSFVVTTDNPGLFAVQPRVSPDGTLTFTPRLLGLGVTRVTVRAVDSGGTANGGVDTSPPQTFTITVV